MDTNFEEIQNTKFTDPILKEIESVLFYLAQSYASLIKDPNNTHEKIQEFDKELGDFIERYQQLYNVTSNLTELELQKIAVEFRNEITLSKDTINSIVSDLQSKVQNNFFKGAKGEPFVFSDFTQSQINSLKVKGDKGDPFIYADFTQQQLDLLLSIHTKTEKTTLLDTDELSVADTTSAFSLKKISWANIKAILLNLFVSKDANGNVGINNNSPLSKLHVGGSIIAADNTYASMNAFIGAILNNNSTTPSLDIRRWNGNGTNHAVIKIAGNSLGEIIFYRDIKSTNMEATTEKMKLDANGNLLVGTSVSNGLDKLQIEGSYSSKAVKAFTGIDLNTLKTRTEVCSVTSTCTNLPIAETGILEVFMFDSASAWVTQRFTAIGYPNTSNQGRTYVRSWMSNNTWSAWVEK